jgi:MFS family permease
MSAPAALALGYLLLAAGLAGYAAAHTLTASLVATVVWSLGDLLMLGRAYALVADLAPPGGASRYLAVYGISWGIAGIAAPIVGTQIIEHAGATALWAGMAAVCLLLAAAHILLPRRLVAGTAPRSWRSSSLSRVRFRGRCSPCAARPDRIS